MMYPFLEKYKIRFRKTRSIFNAKPIKWRRIDAFTELYVNYM